MTAAVDLVLLSAHAETVWSRLIPRLGPAINPHPVVLDQDDSLAAMARRVLDAAPPRFALAGLCMGGYVALEILSTAPRRVTHLALLHASARADSETEAVRRARRIASLSAMRAEWPSLDYVREALPWMLAPAAVRDADVAEAARSVLLATPIRAALGQQVAIAGRPDRLDLLSGLDKPALVVTGRLDRIAPPLRSVEMAERMPGAHLALLEGCGHLSPLEQPERLAGLLRGWLTPGAGVAAQAAGSEAISAI